MRRKLFLLAALCALILVMAAGCVTADPYGYGGGYPGGYGYPNGGGQYPSGYGQPPQPAGPPVVVGREKGPVGERLIPGKIVVKSTIPVNPSADVMVPRCSVKPLPPDPDLKPFVLPEPAYCSMDRGKQGWQEGFLRVGETVWCRFVGKTPDGFGKRYIAVRVDRCRNLLEGLEIWEYPEVVERLEQEIIRERETVVEQVPVPQPYPVPVPQPAPQYYPQPYPSYGYGAQCPSGGFNLQIDNSRRVYRSTNIRSTRINQRQFINAPRVFAPRVNQRFRGPKFCPPQPRPPRNPFCGQPKSGAFRGPGGR